MIYRQKRLDKRLTKNGAGSDAEMAGESGSVGSPVVFKVGPTGGATWELDIVLASIVDDGMTPTEFAGLGSALTNGLKVAIVDDNDNVLHDFLDGGTIKQNSDFALVVGEDVLVSAAAGDDWLQLHWEVNETGQGLHLASGEHFAILIQDNLTGVTSFRASIQGRIM